MTLRTFISYSACPMSLLRVTRCNTWDHMLRPHCQSHLRARSALAETFSRQPALGICDTASVTFQSLGRVGSMTVPVQRWNALLRWDLGGARKMPRPSRG